MDESASGFVLLVPFCGCLPAVAAPGKPFSVVAPPAGGVAVGANHPVRDCFLVPFSAICGLPAGDPA